MDKAKSSGERVLSLEEGLPILRRQLWKHNSILRRNAALQRLGLRIEEPEEVIERIRRHFPEQTPERLGRLNPNRLAFWLEQVIATEEGGSAPAELPNPKASVNSRMIDLLRDSTTHTWSSQKFADKLGCSKSSVAETPAWKELRTAREMARQKRAATTQRRREGGRSTER